MPTYQYACTECDHRFEAVQAFTDDSLTICPVCGGQLRKVYGSVGVVFKGSGFYRTDSRAAVDQHRPGRGSGDKPAPATSPASKESDKGGEKKAAASRRIPPAARSRPAPVERLVERLVRRLVDQRLVEQAARPGQQGRRRLIFRQSGLAAGNTGRRDHRHPIVIAGSGDARRAAPAAWHRAARSATTISAAAGTAVASTASRPASGRPAPRSQPGRPPRRPAAIGRQQLRSSEQPELQPPRAGRDRPLGEPRAVSTVATGLTCRGVWASCRTARRRVTGRDDGTVSRDRAGPTARSTDGRHHRRRRARRRGRPAGRRGLARVSPTTICCTCTTPPPTTTGSPPSPCGTAR